MGIYTYYCVYIPAIGSKTMSEQSLDTWICMDLRAAAHRLTQLYDDARAASGISVTQFSQLHKLLTMDNPNLKSLAEATGLDRSTLGRNIRVLEKMGLVTMKVGEDARSKNIQVTAKGKTVFKEAAPHWYTVQSNLKDKIGEEGRNQLNHLLGELTGAAS